MKPGVVVWFTGLPGSGKTTLANRVAERLPSSIVLDGDEVRALLGARRYVRADRDAFYRILAELAALIACQGHVVLVPATAPRQEHRTFARGHAPRFLEVYVRTPLEICEARDPKGLYARARAGEAPALPGVGEPYEAPSSPDVRADGGHDDVAVSQIEHLVS